MRDITSFNILRDSRCSHRFPQTLLAVRTFPVPRSVCPIFLKNLYSDLYLFIFFFFADSPSLYCLSHIPFTMNFTKGFLFSKKFYQRFSIFYEVSTKGFPFSKNYLSKIGHFLWNFTKGWPFSMKLYPRFTIFNEISLQVFRLIWNFTAGFFFLYIV